MIFLNEQYYTWAEEMQCLRLEESLYRSTWQLWAAALSPAPAIRKRKRSIRRRQAAATTPKIVCGSL